MTEALYAVASRLYQIVRPVRDRHYLQHIRTFPCVACKSTKRQREAMHTGPRGLSQKASDRDSLPGCRPCHRELHRIGAARFQVKHGIDFPALIVMFQEFYSIEFPSRKEAA